MCSDTITNNVGRHSATKWASIIHWYLQTLFERLNEHFSQAGWYGALRIGLMPLRFVKISKSSAMNWGPLLLRNSNHSRRTSSVLDAVVLDMIFTSGHLENASTATRNMDPWKGPAKSKWTLCHGFDGHTHGWSGVTGGAFFTDWQAWHLFAKVSNSLSKPGTTCSYEQQTSFW